MAAPIRTRLTHVFARAFEALGYDARSGEVTVSDRPDLAHYQCNGALPAAKKAGKNPRELAQAVLAAVSQELDASEFSLSIAGAGFVNVRLSDAKLAAELEAVRGDWARVGVQPHPGPARKVVVDFGAPNVAKPMHVGHLRSSIIGDSIVRVLRFFGDEVIGDNHLGDWGTPMGMVLCELKRE
ncbi:MAG: arginine--tRNA ligase, partial [Bdellovibrionota bacterium]